MWASKEKDEPISPDIIEACVNLRGRVYIQKPNLDLPFRPDLNNSKIKIGEYPKEQGVNGLDYSR